MLADEARMLCGPGWTGWEPLQLYALTSVRFRLRREAGVYIIRATRPIERVNDSSDIVYVGKGTLKNRVGDCLAFQLSRNTSPYYSESLCRIKNGLGMPLEFSYKITPSTEDAEELEAKILGSYYRDHYELTPVNRVMPPGADEYWRDG